MSTYPEPSTIHPEAHKRRADYPNLTDFSSSKSLKTSAPTPISEVQQANVIFQKMCADIALEYYNNKNGTRFELVEDEALDSYACRDWSLSWIHCSFNAKEDSSIHNFFGELQYVLPTGPETNKCNILIQGETQIGCGNCVLVTHPIVGYPRGPHGNVNHYASAMMDDDTPRTSAPTPISEVQQANVIFQKMCADIALEYYNNKNGTRFELVEDEALDSYAFRDWSLSWIHCSFNAKEDSSIHNFFGELQYVLPSGPVATKCNILIQGETQIGCGNCVLVTHPIVGYPRGPHGNVNHYASAMMDDDTPRYYPKPPAYSVSINFNTVVWARKRRIRCEKIANRALDHYNKTNGTKFAPVYDDKSTKWSSFSDTWIHISFNASDSSAVKLFFAEIKYDKFSEPAVTVCKILEGETKQGCEHCHVSAVTHPAVGYRGDFSVKTKIDKKDRESCYKIYCEEFDGEIS